MVAGLPAPLAAYFAAKNTDDIDAMLAPFDEAAVVEDEGREHHGRAAIRAWMEETTRRYRPKVEVLDATTVEGRTRVTCSVAGNFPGSPVRLCYAFALDRDAIARLEVR
jgi:hypothetical protein